MSSEIKYISAERQGRFLSCPKCSKNLRVVIKEMVEVDTCSDCNGVWIDLIEEKTVLQMKPEVFTVDELRRIYKVYEPLGRIEKTRYVPCPVCKELMQRKIWGSHSGIVVDKCRDHGTWYDNGELEKIQEYIAAGGIEFEKLKIAETGVRDLEHKMNQEVNRLDKKIDSAYRRARFWSMLGF